VTIETREEKAVGLFREVIAGDRRAAVRRIILYVLAFALVVSPLPALAVVPLALLVSTDQLL
jgi:hypothetical protein